MDAIDDLARQAIACNHCFTNFGLTRPSQDDVAQPRWVGPNYWTAKSKVIVIMTNPGAGEGASQSVHTQRRTLLKRFQEERADLSDVFKDQYADFSKWGNPPGKFKTYIQTALGLTFDKIALLNIAWCATKGDMYPKDMLSACFNKHTERMLKVLSPDAIILSGNEAHTFRQIISTAFPSANIYNVLHYAHRKGRAEEDLYTRNVRKLLGNY